MVTSMKTQLIYEFILIQQIRLRFSSTVTFGDKAQGKQKKLPGL